MRKRVAWFLIPTLVVSASCLAGCAGVSIESRVDSSRVTTLTKVFVVSHLATVSEKFGSWFEDSIRDAFWEVGVDAEVATVDPLSLESDLSAEPQPGFAPDAVLVLKPTLLAGVHMGRSSQATVDASMYDPSDQTRLWRATIRVVSGGDDLPLQKNAAEAMAKKMVGRILKDGFMPPPT